VNVAVLSLENLSAQRIYIESIYPSVDAGRFAVKRIAGEPVDVWADIFRDGHALLAAELLWRQESADEWQRVAMRLDSNDRWTANFVPMTPGRYRYAVEAWTDLFGTWRRDVAAKQKSGLDVSLEVEEGRQLLAKLRQGRQHVPHLVPQDSDHVSDTGDENPLEVDALTAVAAKALRSDLTRSTLFPLYADRALARAGAWYEMIPRSQGRIPGRHGTFDDCIARLPDIAALGFDVVYLTPIHPIGHTNRKGRNNALRAGPDDPGSLYAIGSPEGGHDAVHPQLGTLADFRRFVGACAGHGLEVALISQSSARPITLAHAASGLVHAAAGWVDSIR
jgi:starch synthase (maltosyl-transferring)